MAADRRPSPRAHETFIRMWRIFVLLRCQPHTIDDLAIKLAVSTRTIRRDLKALQAVPLPITNRFLTRKGVRSIERDEWSCGEIPEWNSRVIVTSTLEVSPFDPARLTDSVQGKAIGSA